MWVHLLALSYMEYVILGKSCNISPYVKMEIMIIKIFISFNCCEYFIDYYT